MSPDTASYDHLVQLTDDIGIFEHAEGSTPRRHLGYCLDDAARALVVVSREPDQTEELAALALRYLDFVTSAQAADGRFHNRLTLDREWADEASVEDCWGRALWGLGTAAARSPDADIRTRAAAGFMLGARWRCRFRRTMAFAALGAAEILTIDPDDRTARNVLAAARRVIGRPTGSASWPWPEARLTYANAVLPEALIAAGEHLGDTPALDEGLYLLGWLLDIETRGTHLSVTPVGGWTLGEARPGFDQQPIEVAALADGCARAYRMTGESRWSEGVTRAANWFLGDNDAATPLLDAATGGGCDGLHDAGRNANQGAESTLAMLGTLQHVRQLVRM